MISRMVENISQVQFTYPLIFQPLHFIINFITIIIIVCFDSSTVVSAIAVSLLVIGALHTILLLHSSYHYHMVDSINPDLEPRDSPTNGCSGSTKEIIIFKST